MDYSNFLPKCLQVVSFMKTLRSAASLALFGFLALSGCATSTTVENGYDPAQYLNRPFHAFNKGFDTVLLRPVTKTYDAVVPATIKHVVNNEVRFLSLPGTFVNSMLQGNLERAGDTAARFLVNGTIGGLGALDPATDLRIPEHDEDFGQTLAVWGARQGPYYELPLLGPSSARGFAGRVGDYVLNPLTLVSGSTAGLLLGPVKTAAGLVDSRFRFGDAIDQALYESPDSYITVRNIYLQRRTNAILNGETDLDARPDIYEGGTF